MGSLLLSIVPVVLIILPRDEGKSVEVHDLKSLRYQV